MAAIPPAASFHLFPCLPGPFAQQQAERLQAKLRAKKFAIPERDEISPFPNAHVQSACVGDPPLAATKFGVWLEPPTSAEADQYSQGLKSTELLPMFKGEIFPESFAIGISKTRFIDPLIDRVWDALPRLWERRDSGLVPAADGNIHIRGYQISLQGSNRTEVINQVTTKVNGTYRIDSPVIDVVPNPDFTVTMTDSLSISGERLQCIPASDLDVDIPGAGWLLGFLVAGPVGVIGLGIGADYGEDSVGSELPEEGGLGCRAAAEAPSELPYGDNQIMKLRYSSVEVIERSSEIRVRGQWEIVPASA